MKVVFVAHTLAAGSLLLAIAGGLALTRASQISTVELDGWRIAYESRGEGNEALVFVHGANSSRRIWHKQMDTLEIGRKLVAVDLIGHGDSDRPQTGYSMELFARSIAAVMDAEGIGCATLVGHSNGVPAVRQLYRLFPERVEAIVAVDGAFRNTISAEMAAWMRAAFARTDFEEFRAGMADMMPTFSLSDEDIALIRADMMATPKHVMEAGLESFVDPAIWRDDPIDTPLLILLAQQPTWTPEYIEYVRDIGPRVEYHMWENVSHFLMLERPDAFDELLTDFVGRLPGC